MTTGSSPDRIVVICTANQCRSPMAEGLLRRHLAELGIDAAVDSGGLLPGGVAPTADAVAVLAARGIDIAAHRSRPLAELDLHRADVIIAMERRHVQEAVLVEPSVRSRTFTLPELARRSAAAPPRRADERLRDWAASLSADRTTRDLVGLGEEVADPIGRSRARYTETAALLDDLLRQVVARAWPAEASAASAATTKGGTA